MEKDVQDAKRDETNTGVSLDRREFTAAAVMAMLAGVSITISACGGGGGGGGNPNQPSPGGNGEKLGNVSANHGHVARITAAELTAANAMTLDIRGQADHPHTVTLTAAEVAAIAGGQRVGRASSEDAFHTHTVTFN